MIGTKIKRNLLILSVLGVLFSGSAKPVQADYWSAAASAAYLKQSLEEFARQIEGAVLATAKSAFVQIMNTQIVAMVGGGSGGGAFFITNFNDFLIQQPTQQAYVNVNNFLTQSTHGTHIPSNYVELSSRNPEVRGESIVAGEQDGEPEWQFEEGGWRFTGEDDYNSYPEYLVDNSKKSLRPDGCQSTLEKPPSEIFGTGDWQSFNSFFDCGNNVWGKSLSAQQFLMADLQQQKELAMVQAIAGQGYLPKTDGAGNVTTPAVTIGDIVDGLTKVGNDVVTAATNPGELIGSITGAAMNIATGLIETGIATATNAAVGQINVQINGALEELGPGGYFDVRLQTTNPIQGNRNPATNSRATTDPLDQILHPPGSDNRVPFLPTGT